MTKKIKNQNKNTQIKNNEEHDVEESNFISKIQKGSGKYKGKLPSSVLIVAKLGTFCPSVLIPRKTLRMKMKEVNNTRKK